MTFNYESRWHSDPIITRTTICAKQFLKAVNDHRQEEPEVGSRPIIILAHSFGGIVIEKLSCNVMVQSSYKQAVVTDSFMLRSSTIQASPADQAILQAIGQGSDPTTEFNLADAVTGIVFFGTPHRGTSAARFPYFFALVARYITGWMEVSILRELAKDSLQLRDILGEFAAWAKRETISVFCFFEQKRTDYARKTGIPFLSWTEMVVDEASAVIDGHACLGSPVDHLKLNKFAGPEDDNFKAVVAVIEGFVGKGISLMHNRANNSGRPKPVMLIPFLRDADFVGREASLSCVEDIISHPATGARAALVGIGGAGKSQIAIEYAYRTREKNKDVSIFWVRASSPARFYASYSSIAAELHLPGFDKAEPRHLDLVQRWLASEVSGKWLLILDNIDDPGFVHASHEANDIQQYEYTVSQYLPQRAGGVILATTRNREAAFDLVGKKDNMVDVNPMQDAEAMSLLEKKTSQSNASREELIELVNNLENIPLAITQAAAYISRRQRMSVQKYIDFLQADEESSASLLSVEGNDLRRDSGVPNSVIRTWQVSFELIKRQNELAADFLASMCMFDKQGIPEYLLRDDTKAIDFEEAIEMLLSFAIITVDVHGLTFSMHRLVQLATRAWLRAHDELERGVQAALAMLARNYPLGEFENWRQCQALEPHAESVLKFENQGHEEKLLRAQILEKRAYYYVGQERYSLAENLAREGLNIRRALLGEDHPATMTIMGTFAAVLMRRGRSEDAEKLIVKLIEQRRNTFGEEHLGTLTNLAEVYGRQKRWEEAEKLSLQVMEARRRASGEEHPYTLMVMGKLAVIYINQKRWREAEELNVQVLEAQRRVLGEDHPDTLFIMENLSSIYVHQARWAEAEKLQVQVIEIRRRVLGEEHPDTLDSIMNFALAYMGQGRFTEAEGLFVEVLKGRQKVLGDEHPDTLSSMADLGDLYQNQGRLPEAEVQYERLLEARRRVSGEEHPDTLAVKTALASVRREAMDGESPTS